MGVPYCYLNAGEDMVCVREKGFCKDLLLYEKCPLRKGQNEAMALCVSPTTHYTVQSAPFVFSG